MGFEYYPLRVGNYFIYQVQKNNDKYELKVTVTDSSVNDKGIVTYTMVREKRVDTFSSWQSLETWSAKLTDNKIIQNEGNVLFVKLTFPPSLNLKWDGNQYNNRKIDENPYTINLPYDGNVLVDSKSDYYFISELEATITLPSGFEADNTVTVIHNNYQDIVTGTDQRKEVYAKGVGLIYKEINQYLKCSGSICSGDKAGILIQSLTEYGRL